ncbi:MAG: hypothetical protein E7624_06305 [Ruminococcaceae bacterium]|nr:hypothetical protein [Oscillospiraceae bacterium]
MMKRIFTLLLAVLLLTSLASCSKEEPAYGTFYVEDGITQNTLVTLTLKTDNLTAPVEQLSFSLQETSDFYVRQSTYISGTDCTHLIEKYTKGAWEEAPYRGISKNEPTADFSPEELDYRAHHTYDGKMTFRTAPGVIATEPRHYLPLTPGIYRIRVKYSLYTDDENAHIPEEQLEAVAYFTVSRKDGAAEYEYGTFYEEDGIFQNTSITLSIESEDLVAPVKELKYVLHDNSDYWVDATDDYKINVSARDVLEIYRDGTWQKVEVRGGGMTERGYLRVVGEPTERKDLHSSMMFYDPEQEDRFVKHYAYLEPGFYRLRVAYYIFTDDDYAYIPEEQLEAVACFTVEKADG